MSGANSKQSTKKPATRSRSQLNNQASSSVELELSWEARHRIINVLDQLSLILFRANVSSDLKKKVQEKTNDLMTRLTCLRPSDTQSEQTDGQSGSQCVGQNGDQRDDDQRPSKRQRTDEDGESQAVSSQLFFEIPLSLRTELVNQLLCNLDAIMYANERSNESRKQIADRNANLTIQLLEMPIKVKDGAADESDPFEPESHMVVGAVKTEPASPSENLQAISQKADTPKPGFTIDYELEEVANFFADSRQIVGQSLVWRGCRWRIWLRMFSRREDCKDVPYLGFYLEQLDDLRDAFNASFDLNVLEPSTNAVLKKTTISCSFLKRTLKGMYNFASFDELENQKFIENDRLRLQICLQVID